MRAVIMAGGKGRRLYPYTVVLPKPLVPLGEQSIIEIVIRQLACNGFDRITIAVGYHADLIMAVVGNGEKYNVQIDYSLETKPMNTIGPLTLIENLDEPFLVMNGDLLTDLNYFDFYRSHCQNDSIATIATHKRHVELPLGVLTYSEQNEITSFKEKPKFDYDVSMGIYIFDPRIMDFIPKNQSFGFDELIHKLLQSQERICAYPFTGHWLDMGTHEDLEEAMEEYETHRERYLPNV